MNLLILLLTLAAPLGLDWNKTNNRVPVIQEYMYHYGDVYYDPIVYAGTSDLMGLETELQLYFANKKISKAILILGPAGLNEQNCIEKLKEYTSLMNGKYGKYSIVKQWTSSLKNDLLFVSPCKLYQNGLKRTQYFWKLKKFNIDVILLGDDEGLYIETIYTNKNLSKFQKKKKRKKIYKRISKEIKK